MGPGKSAAKGEPKTAILIVDDHPIIRKGVIHLIEDEPDMIACGQAANAAEALAAVEKLKPKVVILELLRKDGSGLDLIKDIHRRAPRAAVLVLSMQDEALYAERALRAGARGYIMKDAATENLVAAIRRVRGGETYLSKAMSARLLNRLVGVREGAAAPIEQLSDRELQVLELIGGGLGTREIAQRLYLSVKTIETYRANIKLKLHLTSAAKLVQHAVQWVQLK